jgi:outer membrane immunogenic protein
MNIKALSLALTLITVSGVAIADTVTTPASSSTAATKSTYDWTGVYVGGFVGGASGANGTNQVTRSINDTSGNFYPRYTTNSSSNYSTNGSFMGGGTIGYNWQIPKTALLVGLEGEYGYLGMSGGSQSHATASNLASSTQNKTTIGSDYGYGLVGGRLGYALDRSLFYVKSGAVFTQVKTTQSTATNTDGVYEDNFPTPTANSGGTTTGYAIGGGVEYAPTWYNNKNMTLKVEYLYFGIPTSYNSNAEGTADTTAISLQSYHNSTGGISTAKIGVNYKF